MRRVRPVAMLPTAVTLGNLFSGFLAIAYLTDSLAPAGSSGPAELHRILLYERSIMLIFLAMVFDTLDGFVARITRQATAFGAQVDSICDVISFGAAPALLFKVLVDAEPRVVTPKMALILAVIFLACGVLRLARFTLETETDEDSHVFFEGLPIPAAAAVVAALVYANIQLDPSGADSWIRQAMPFVIPIVGFLMVSRIPYVHLGTFLMRRRNFSSVVLGLFVLGLVVRFFELALPIFCVGFVVSGPLLALWRLSRRRRRKGQDSEQQPEEAPA